MENQHNHCDIIFSQKKHMNIDKVNHLSKRVTEKTNNRDTGKNSQKCIHVHRHGFGSNRRYLGTAV